MANLNNILVNSSRKEIVTGRKMTSLIMTAAMIISLFAGMTLGANAATNSTTLQNGGLDIEKSIRKRAAGNMSCRTLCEANQSDFDVSGLREKWYNKKQPGVSEFICRQRMESIEIAEEFGE